MCNNNNLSDHLPLRKCSPGVTTNAAGYCLVWVVNVGGDHLEDGGVIAQCCPSRIVNVVSDPKVSVLFLYYENFRVTIIFYRFQLFLMVKQKYSSGWTIGF